MTESELRDLYSEAYKIIQNERKWRMYVWREKPEVLKIKTKEMDRLLHLLTTIKDVAKVAVYEQSRLLSPEGAQPRKVEYK